MCFLPPVSSKYFVTVFRAFRVHKNNNKAVRDGGKEKFVMCVKLSVLFDSQETITVPKNE